MQPPFIDILEEPCKPDARESMTPQMDSRANPSNLGAIFDCVALVAVANLGFECGRSGVTVAKFRAMSAKLGSASTHVQRWQIRGRL